MPESPGKLVDRMTLIQPPHSKTIHSLLEIHTVPLQLLDDKFLIVYLAPRETTFKNY